MGKVIYRGPITPCIRISFERPPCKFMVDTDKRWQESWAKKTPWCKNTYWENTLLKSNMDNMFKKKLGGGFNYFFSPRSLGKWSTLTSKFFKWVGVQPPRKPIIVDFGYLFILLNSCGVNVCEIFHKKIPKLPVLKQTGHHSGLQVFLPKCVKVWTGRFYPNFKLESTHQLCWIFVRMTVVISIPPWYKVGDV